MGKLRYFDVTFNNPQGVFQAGESVHGNVVVDFADSIKLRSIYIECQGKSKVHWDKWMLRDNSRTYYECYRAEESYFKKELCIFGDEPGGTAISHPVGKQQYPFEFSLPSKLPTSFEGAHGYIRYLCKVTVERPWKFDHTTKKAFSVISELDLNKEHAVRAPALFERQTPIRCCCCINGSITATFKLDQRGYVPGQNILINAEVHNASNTHINRCKVILCQHVSFYGLHQGVSNSAISCTNKLKRHTTSRIVKCIVRGEVSAGASQVWLQEPMSVPSLPPSRLDGCKIIEIFYTVTFSVEPNWGSKLQMSTEVIVGTVPLRQLIMCPPSYSSALLDRRPSTPPPPFEAGYDGALLGFFLEDIPPPSYEVSVFGRSRFEDEEEIDGMEYTPVYAVYNCTHLRSGLAVGLTSAPDLTEQIDQNQAHTNRLCVLEGKETLPLISLDRRASDSESYLRDKNIITVQPGCTPSTNLLTTSSIHQPISTGSNQHTGSNESSGPTHAIIHPQWHSSQRSTSQKSSQESLCVPSVRHPICMTDSNGFLTVPNLHEYMPKSHSPRTLRSPVLSRSPSPKSCELGATGLATPSGPTSSHGHGYTLHSRTPSPSFSVNSNTSSDGCGTRYYKHPMLTVQTSAMLDQDSDVSISPQLSLISNDTFNDWSPMDTPGGTPLGTPEELPGTPASAASGKTGFFRFDRHSVGRFLFSDKKELAGVHRACSLDGPPSKQRPLAVGKTHHSRARRVRSAGSESTSKQTFSVPLIEVTDCDCPTEAVATQTYVNSQCDGNQTDS